MASQPCGFQNMLNHSWPLEIDVKSQFHGLKSLDISEVIFLVFREVRSPHVCFGLKLFNVASSKKQNKCLTMLKVLLEILSLSRIFFVQ